MRNEKQKITLQMIEESGVNPWAYLKDIAIEEASKIQDVNSDDESIDNIKEKKQTDSDNEDQENDQENQEGNLSDDELNQLMEQLQQEEDPDKYLKKLFDEGSINQKDIEKIQMAFEQNQDPQNPEDEKDIQIRSIQETMIRFSIYDKLNNLDTKLEFFLDNLPNIDDDFYKSVEQLHEYIKIISNLIFNLEINLVYQLFANIEMKLIDLFKNYQETQETQVNKG